MGAQLYTTLYFLHIIFILSLLGGFYGSKDPRGDLLLKKRAMLQAEGVVFDAGNRKRKICDSADNDISGDTSRVRIALGSVFTF